MMRSFQVFAALSSLLALTSAQDAVIGYGEGTTGGGDASPVTVTDCDALKDAASGDDPAVVHIDGLLSGCGYISVGSNKSLLGVGDASGLEDSGFQVEDVTNVIIRNLILGPAPGGGDLVEIQSSTNVWVDHNEFKSIGLVGHKDDFDGLLDIVQGSDFVTASWNIFHDHWKTLLIGSSDDNEEEDGGKLHVTLHHNYFHTLGTRTPMARFGNIHVFNSYHSDVDSGVALRSGAAGWVQNSVFENCDGSIHSSPSGLPACITETGNIFTDSEEPDVTPCDDSDAPPYDYELDDAADVANIVLEAAGVGKIGL